MKCAGCKFSKKSKSKIYQFYCKKYRTHAIDEKYGCLNGEPKK